MLPSISILCQFATTFLVECRSEEIGDKDAWDEFFGWGKSHSLDRDRTIVLIVVGNSGNR